MPGTKAESWAGAEPEGRSIERSNKIDSPEVRWAARKLADAVENRRKQLRGMIYPDSFAMYGRIVAEVEDLRQSVVSTDLAGIREKLETLAASVVWGMISARA